MTTDTILKVGYDLTLGADGQQAVGELESDGCCADPLCTDYCDVACSFVDILPTGPMWDLQKRSAIESILGGGSYDPCDPYTCPVETDICATMSSYAVYGARVLHDAVFNIIRPTVAEASPYTASATLDDWLGRYGWEDCYRQHCRTVYLSELSPYEFDGACGSEYCEPEFPADFECALKHNILRALERSRRGVIKNLDGINFVIEPLGAVLRPREPYPTNVQGFLDGNCADDPDEGPPCFCEDIEFEICNIGERINACPRPTDDCTNEPQRTVAARQSYTCNGVTTQIYPAVISAECIVRSLLTRKCPNIIFRCPEPSALPIPFSSNFTGTVGHSELETDLTLDANGARKAFTIQLVDPPVGLLGRDLSVKFARDTDNAISISTFLLTPGWTYEAADRSLNWAYPNFSGNIVVNGLAGASAATTVAGDTGVIALSISTVDGLEPEYTSTHNYNYTIT